MHGPTAIFWANLIPLSLQCDADARCHAFDMDFPFQGTCWFFDNAGAGIHAGNGVATSRCRVAPVLSNYPTSGDGSWKCWQPEGHGNDITHTGTGMGQVRKTPSWPRSWPNFSPL